MRAVFLALAAAALLPAAHADLGRGESVTEGRGNPIRKVVTLLQKMQVNVMAEGKKEEELYEKFQCYCKSGDAGLSASIAAADGKVPEVESQIREQEAQKEQLAQDLKDHQVSRSEAKEAIAKATALREKDRAEFEKESAELKTNIAALNAAIAAIDKGMSGGFLQTTTAQIIRRIALNGPSMNDADRQDLLAFMQGGNKDGYSPKGGEISGILKQLQDEMDKSLADITAEENSAAAGFGELVAAKSKEIEALTMSIEQKSQRVGELAISIAMAKNDLSDTQAALMQDKELLAGLSSSCETKAKEWEERQSLRSQELVALADTIKVLNDDDALELFKKTLPSAAAFMQLGANSDNVRNKAMNFITKVRKHPGDNIGIDLIAMALHGKKMGFEKIIVMIDELVATLKREQIDDEAKKEMCDKQLDFSDDKKKTLEQVVADHETSMEDAEESMGTLETEIKALELGIKELDKSVADATEQRKEEHKEYQDLLAGNNAAKEVIAWAKNRLAKFYTPKLYKAPPKRELSEAEQITVNMGGTVEEAPAGGIAGTGIGAAASFVQIRAHTQVKDASAPPPPPETFGPYTKKSEESGGVIAMIDLLIKDLDKEMQEAEVMEKDAQSEYETMMEESASKRATDAKSMTQKESEKANMEGSLEQEKDKKTVTTKDLLATVDYISNLHLECDWLLTNFDARKAARTSEIEALGNAKAVLNGADYSLLQTARSGFMAKRL